MIKEYSTKLHPEFIKLYNVDINKMEQDFFYCLVIIANNLNFIENRKMLLRNVFKHLN